MISLNTSIRTAIAFLEENIEKFLSMNKTIKKYLFLFSFLHQKAKILMFRIAVRLFIISLKTNFKLLIYLKSNLN